MTLEEVKAEMTRLGYVIFTGPGNLNIVGARTIPGTLDAFDDWLFAWNDTETLVARCTMDPGKPSILNPRRQDGTAIIAPGQHRAAYTIGTHKGQYRCLVPCRPIPVFRDYDRDADIEYLDESYSSSVQIHRANPARESTVVGAWSEGCCVVADPDDFDTLMRLVDEQIAAGLGSKFTFTVLG